MDGQVSLSERLPFLAWTRPSARIFLGNNGVNAVGAWLPVLIAGGVSDGARNSMLGAFVVVGVFAFEFVATVIRRLLRGGAFTGGDRDHSYLLSELTGSRVRITVLYWLTGMAFAMLGWWCQVRSLSWLQASASPQLVFQQPPPSKSGSMLLSKAARQVTPARRTPPLSLGVSC